VRILVATTEWFPDLRGGSARVATETARQLAHRGHDVTVLAPGTGTEEEIDDLLVARVIRRGRAPQTITDVFETRRAARSFGRRFDVVVAHGATTAVGLARAGLDVPLVLVYHASARRELRFDRRRNPRSRSWLAWTVLDAVTTFAEARSVSSAARIFVLSEFSASLIRADHPAVSQRVRRVSGGVDTDFFSPGDGQAAARARVGAAPDAPLLVTARRLEPRMGIEELLHALGSIDEARRPELAIVGKGSLQTDLEEQRERLGLSRHVAFLGAVSDERLRDWYRAADAFVLPTAAYEGFGMVTAEALSCGTPVVATPVGATPELLAPLDRRFLAASASPADLAVSLREVMTIATPELRRRCRAYAKSSFDWRSVIEAWEDGLIEAVDSHPG
jgi:glycosyltransferase involved in cell wall biosynthesis